MKIEVSRDDIQHSAQLLADLKAWERFVEIAREYNQGEVSLSMKGCADRTSTVKVSVDAYGLRNVRDNPVEKANAEVKAFLGAAAKKMAEGVCEILKRHMPLPLESNE